MKLTIRRNQGDPRDVKLVREAVPFMLEALMPPSHVRRVVLHVSFTAMPNDFGDIEVERSPLFRLRLDPQMDSVLMILTLAHELVHLSQVMMGRLKVKRINDLPHWYWDSESYGTDPYGTVQSELPWERDAIEREVDLACRFLNRYVTSLNGS